MTSASPNPRRRFLRFSLRGLLLLVTVFGVGLGWVIHEAKKQGIAVRELERVGCRVEYASGTPMTMLERVRTLLGDDKPRDVAFVGVVVLNSQLTDTEMSHLQTLPHLKALGIEGAPVTDSGLAYVKGLSHLWHLSLSSTHVTDAGMIYLQGLTDLAHLSLIGTQVTDAGLVSLHGMTNLTQLSLSGTMVTDAGLAHLQGLVNLQQLDLKGTQVTDAGVQELQKALPKCQIEY